MTLLVGLASGGLVNDNCKYNLLMSARMAICGHILIHRFNEFAFVVR